MADVKTDVKKQAKGHEKEAAESKKDSKGPENERVITIPLRKKVLPVPRKKRANKACFEAKRFLLRHFKEAGDARLSDGISKAIWSSGIQNPPSRIKVMAGIADGIVRARLPDEQAYKKEEPKKASVLGGAAEKLLGDRGKKLAEKMDGKEEAKPEKGKDVLDKAERDRRLKPTEKSRQTSEAVKPEGKREEVKQTPEAMKGGEKQGDKNVKKEEANNMA